MAHLRTLILACCVALLTVLASATAAAADGPLNATSVLPPVAPASLPPSQPSPVSLPKVAAQPTGPAGAVSAVRKSPPVAASTAPLQPASGAVALPQQTSSAVAAPPVSNPVPQQQIAAKPTSPNSSTVAPAGPAKPVVSPQPVPHGSVAQTSAAAPPPTAPVTLSVPPDSPASVAPLKPSPAKSKLLPDAVAASTNGPSTSLTHSAGGAVSPIQGQAMAAGSGVQGAAGMPSPLRRASTVVGGATPRLATSHLSTAAVLPPVVASNMPPQSPPAAHPLAAVTAASAAVQRLPAVPSGVVGRVAPVLERTAPLNTVASVQERAALSLPAVDVRLAPSTDLLSQSTTPTVAIPQKVTATLLPATGPARLAAATADSSRSFSGPPGGLRQRSVFADQAAARFPSPPHSQVTGDTDAMGRLESAEAGTTPLQRSAEYDYLSPRMASRPLAAVAPPQSAQAAARVADAIGTPFRQAPGPGKKPSWTPLQTPAFGMAERPLVDQATGVTPMIRSTNAPPPVDPRDFQPYSALALGIPRAVPPRSLDPEPPLLPFPGLPLPSLPPLWGGNGDAASAGFASAGAGRGHGAVLALLALLGLLVERRRRCPGPLLTSLPAKRPLPTG
jgi:hypothetical protein